MAVSGSLYAAITDFTAEFVGNSYRLLDLAHRAYHALLVLSPDVDFGATAPMQAHRYRHQ